MCSLKFSIAMTTYNGEKYVEEQIRSILDQTIQPYELIICDDASKDSTVNIIEKLKGKADFPIRIYSNSVNIGSNKNFEKAIKLCTGDIVVLCDQDDFWIPDKLKEIEDKFVEKKEIGFVFSNAFLVNESLEEYGISLWDSVKFSENSKEMIKVGNAFELFLKRPVVTGATVAFKKCYVEYILPIPDGIIHDYWISLIVSSIVKTDFIDKKLIKYRIHANQQVGASKQLRRKTIREYIYETYKIISTKDNQLDNKKKCELLLNRWQAFDSFNENKIQHKSEKVVKDLLEHIYTREGLSKLRIKRVIKVTNEIKNKRYYKYSSGKKSALKDLLLK